MQELRLEQYEGELMGSTQDEQFFEIQCQREVDLARSLRAALDLAVPEHSRVSSLASKVEELTDDLATLDRLFYAELFAHHETKRALAHSEWRWYELVARYMYKGGTTSE